MLRPIPSDIAHSPTHAIVDRRRQPTRFSVDSSEQEFSPPRAHVPPRFRNTVDISDGKDSSEETRPNYVIQNPSNFEGSIDEAKRRRIEARWKRLGINFKTITYPYRQNSESKEEATTSYPIRQLNVPRVENKPKLPHVTEPILHVVNPVDQEDETFLKRVPQPIPADVQPSGDYHSRTRPVLKGVKFTQETLSVRPRLRIRRPGEKAELPLPEDPNLTPFMNNARVKFGYGVSSTVATPIRLITTTPYVPPTTPSRHPTTTTTTTATPVEEFDSGTGFESGGDSGLDSGAGFGFGPSELPPEFQNVGFGVGGDTFNFNVPADKMDTKNGEKSTTTPATTTTSKTTTTPKPKKVVQRKQPSPDFDKDVPAVIPQNSGLRAVQPPKEFGNGGFGSGGGGGFGGGGGSFGGGGGAVPSSFAANKPPTPDPDFGGEAPKPSEEDYFTGESALTPSKGPTGDGYGPAVFPGGAAPPPVPAVGLGGAAAGKAPYNRRPGEDVTENPVTTVKPSALLNVLNKADLGFNQVIEHFEHGTPVETAAIDILEVALGSQKLDSQAKLLGHVDRTIGLDNLQRLQRWANTAGAMDVFKDQFLKFAKNFQPAADLLPTVPPQLEYLFKTSGK
ncbi:unnamed protein product [Caenorhabditis bovis]|uniref:Uncharacterized protein n=1 Tax=Caenorhabditis bovis TaxID=2654633 RepID=A0A8S1DZ33_9PELO|nr:unnamed protein product [Caenorhabditis bovis]